MIALILNGRAGGGTQREQILAALRARDLRVQLFDDENPRAAATKAASAGAETLIAAGGDGTVNAVASAAVLNNGRIGVIPMGTLNHFARDLRLPLAVEPAIDVIRHGRDRCVDVGEVNGRYFVNNSGVGLYPGLVAFREAQQRRGWGKPRALFWAVMMTLRRMPKMEVCLTTEESRIVRRTPMVFVGNNEYQVQGVRAGTRESLDRGTLFISVTTARSALDLVRLSLLAMLGRLRDRPEFEEFSTAEAEIDLARRYVRVSLDGEITFLETPLHYRIHPGALRVVTP